MTTSASFADLLENVVDNRGKTCPTASTGTPLIATNCVKDSTLFPTFEKVRYVDDATMANWFRDHPQPGDILFVCKGSPGQTCLVPDPVNFCIAQDMVAVRADRKKVYPPYLFAALRSSSVQNQIANMHVGTMIPHFKKSDFDKLFIPLPDGRTQVAIGDIYLSLSQKIELNRRMNETLEAQARALFRDWFVDFGPVKAKMAGDAPYLTPDLWSLFPDRIDDDGVPEGWEKSQLGKHVLNFDSKRVPLSKAQRAERPGEFPYHGATSAMDRVDDYLFDGVYTLVGEDGSVADADGHAITQYVFGKFWVNNHAHVLQGKSPVSTEQILLFFKHEHVAPFITGAVQLKLSQGRMNSMPFIFAGSDICEAFNRIVTPLFGRIRTNENESRTLAATRDLLLPKLMSGEIRIGEAVKQLEEAL